MITAGIDIGSTYSKAVLLDGDQIVGRAMLPTGFRFAVVARTVFEKAMHEAGIDREAVGYVVATGIGRHQVDIKNAAVTSLTAAARGAHHFFPGTRTVLDVGGQTMMASRTDETARVRSFRLNDKCAAGTGAFLEKTARYMGTTTADIGPLMATSTQPVPISGVCAVFAESEVINHLSLGVAPADIMRGAADSLVARSVQLMKRVRAEPEYTLVGGILRFASLIHSVQDRLGSDVNVPPGDLCQFTSAVGCAVLGQRRLLRASPSAEPAAAAAPG